MRHRFGFQAVAALALLLSWQVAGAPRWQPPLPGPIRVVRPFERPVGPYGAGHRGVDLAAAPGSVVRAAGSGVVAFAGPVGGREVVVVRHDARTSTEYEPVVSTVEVGARVPGGAPLGLLQLPTGHCGAVSCLHWGLRRGGRYEDPMTLLRPAAAPVLLPFLDRPGSDVPPPAQPATPMPTGPTGARPGRLIRRITHAGTAATLGLAVALGPAFARRLRRERPAA